MYQLLLLQGRNGLGNSGAQALVQRARACLENGKMRLLHLGKVRPTKIPISWGCHEDSMR